MRGLLFISQMNRRPRATEVARGRSQSQAVGVVANLSSPLPSSPSAVELAAHGGAERTRPCPAGAPQI